MDGWTEYRREHREPCIISPRGHLSNHHWCADGSIGERVTEEQATHVRVTVTTVVLKSAIAETVG